MVLMVQHYYLKWATHLYNHVFLPKEQHLALRGHSLRLNRLNGYLEFWYF